MDIAAFSMSLSQVKVMQAVSNSVMNMAMDTAKTDAANLVEMLGQARVMEQSVQPHIGSQIDIRA